jgi:fatty acyl-CoA reductase
LIWLQVESVYLLVRSKKGLTAQQRVHKLLCGPLFHQLHKQVAAGRPNVFSKVRVVEGDMDLPGLGLSDTHRELLLTEATVVIHSAASLTLDAHIQDALR